ncbi:MAG TPA: pseudouridine synthase, partial [Geminicoccaceae bacterium]|nr:pseudouridine synthase [Geminicoccaceae bacterium]
MSGSGDGSESRAGNGAERIAKRIARAGLCSRREAEAWIAAGRVAVDGEVLASPAVTVRPGQRVTVDGKPLPEAEPARLFRYHKPKGVMTTARDPEGRPTIYADLPPELPRLMPVGRLDFTSEGLLLLTNDGELKRRLELPSTGWLRRYRVRVFGAVQDPLLARLAKGLTVDGIVYGPIEAKLDRVQGDNAWLTVALREGKNREIRHVMEHLGLTVNRLIRTSYGPFQLGLLRPRAVEEVRPKVLKEQ